MYQLKIDFEQRGASEQTPPPAVLALTGNIVERRAFNTIFKRAEGTGRTVTGYAAVFNSETVIGGWYKEVIEPGAFDEAIAASDCRALFNHDGNCLLARQSSGTLKLSLDERGLVYEFESPDTTVGNDILVMMERGDLKESSFAFTVKEQEWREEKDEDGDWEYTRVIKKVEMLYDVSPVTYPAYADTTVAKRSLDTWKEEQFTVHSSQFTVPAAPGPSADLLRLIFG
jgi:uncharacterized protein